MKRLAILAIPLLALGTAGCIPVPTDVQIGDGTMVTAPEPEPTAWANCVDLTGHPFRWWGPASHLPEGCHVVATDPGAPLLQASSTPPVSRGAK